MFKENTTFDLIGQAELMQRMFNGDDLSLTASKLIEASQANQTNAEALLDLSHILLLRGDKEIGLLTQMQALNIKQLFSIQKRGGFRLLVIKTPGDFMANTPVEFMLRTSDITADELYIAPDLPYPTLLDYDLIFVAISEADENVSALKMVETLLQQWQIPYVNNPDEIPMLARDRVCELMDTVSGIYMPQNLLVDRSELADMAGLQNQLSEFLVEDHFPITARPKGTHAGQGLSKLSSYKDIENYLELHKDQEFYIAPYSDYRSPDGMFRKYRIVLISGKPFLCHMAISENWLVHYLNAGMAFDEEKRFEEDRAMTFFDTGFAERHKRAFQSLANTIDLEYFGIDCAETPDGQLLIFELANAMVVHDMDPVDMFPYKQPAMHKVFNAFHEMLHQKAEA